MSLEVEEVTLPPALRQARAQAAETNLPYAGGVAPAVAWGLVQGRKSTAGRRAHRRRAQVRRPCAREPACTWATGTALTRNPRFVRELEAKLARDGGKDAVVLLLCRSGKRSALAAEAAAKTGFSSVFNVLEGFEGEIDANQHRGGGDGWRFHGLPWVQED